MAFTMTERAAFEAWIKETGAFTDWTRYGDGYAKPLVDRTWRAWQAAVAWGRAHGEKANHDD